MELSMSVLGAIILFIMFAPIAYLIYNISSEKKKLKKTFLNLAKDRNIAPNQIDIIGKLLIGIDSNSKKLVYGKIENLVESFDVINLNALKDCKVKTIQNTNKIMDWVGLEMLEGNLRKEIAFYIESNNEAISGNPEVCLESAKRWENTIRLSTAS